MSKKSGYEPINVSRRKEQIPPSGSATPMHADTIFYFLLSSIISLPFFLPMAYVLSNNYFLAWYEQFFAIIGIYVVSDLIGGYIASFPVARVVAKSYNASYFVSWYTERQRNILRSFLNWIFNATFYTTGIFYISSMMAFGTVSWETIIVMYFIIKAISAAMAHIISQYLMNIKLDVTSKK